MVRQSPGAGAVWSWSHQFLNISGRKSDQPARPWAGGDGLLIKDLLTLHSALQCWLLDNPHQSSELESRAVEWRVG